MAKITTDMIRPFSGEGDVVGWLAKVELVAALTEVEKVSQFLPLYLEGSALAVYLEMSEEDKEDVEKIKQRLKQVYSDSVFVAYSKLTSMSWTGEAVDVYATEIRRLVGLAGFTGTEAERLVRLTFVNSMPESISIELQQIKSVENMAMNEILARARVLTASNSTAKVGAAAVVGKQQRRGEFKGSVGRRGGGSEVGSFKGKCFSCGGPHMARMCPDKKPIVCYTCGKEGHMSYSCESSGN